MVLRKVMNNQEAHSKNCTFCDKKCLREKCGKKIAEVITIKTFNCEAFLISYLAAPRKTLSL